MSRMIREERADLGSRSHPFPVAWGARPADSSKVAAWAASHIRRAQACRRQTGVAALAQLRRKLVDPSLLRPELSADDALRVLDRKASRFAAMCRMVGEKW